MKSFASVILAGVAALTGAAQDATKGNSPPPTPALSYPADGATVNRWGVYSWEAVADPDGDAVTYTFQFTDAADFSSFDAENVATDSEITGIEKPYIEFDFPINYPDTTEGRWRVLAVDSEDSASAGGLQRSVVRDYNDGLVPGAIAGTLLSFDDGSPIVGTMLSLDGEERTSGIDGTFIFESVSSPSLLDLMVIPDAFRQSLIRASSDWEIIREYEFQLVPITQFFWGDVSIANGVTTSDAIEMIMWVTRTEDAFTIEPETVRPLFPPEADPNGNGMVDVNDASQVFLLNQNALTAFTADTNGDGIGPESETKGADRIADRDSKTLEIMPGGNLVPGQSLFVDLTTDDASELAGYQCKLEYDPDVLQFIDQETTSITGIWFIIVNDDVEGGLYIASGIQAQSVLAGSGSLLSLEFEVKSDAPSLDPGLAFSEPLLFEIDGDFIPINFVGPSGGFDVDGNGASNAADIQLVINGVLQLPIALDLDVNQDGSVNAIDIQTIINNVLGL